MKVASAFLPNVRLNKVLPSVLNLHLCCCFFSFVLFVLAFYLLFPFLLSCFIVLEESVSPVLALKRTFLCGFTCIKSAYETKFGYLVYKQYYILLVFLRIMEKNYLRSLRIITFSKSKLVHCEKDG